MFLLITFTGQPHHLFVQTARKHEIKNNCNIIQQKKTNSPEYYWNQQIRNWSSRTTWFDPRAPWVTEGSAQRPRRSDPTASNEESSYSLQMEMEVRDLTRVQWCTHSASALDFSMHPRIQRAGFKIRVQSTIKAHANSCLASCRFCPWRMPYRSLHKRKRSHLQKTHEERRRWSLGTSENNMLKPSLL